MGRGDRYRERGEPKGATVRSVPEWIGKTSDSAIPARVKLRVFERHGGICHISGQKIMPGDKWDCDHVQALVNGGENRESNLAPALTEHHKEKTRSDVAMKSKDRRVRSKHMGIKKPKGTIPGSKGSRWKRKLDGTVVPR